MINTRSSIFVSLMRLITELTKHGDANPIGFKHVLYAIILNDMREWSQYFPNIENREKLDQILENYILNHKEFQIERFVDQKDLYRNVNTPQDNTTWSRVYDNDYFVQISKLDE